MLLEFSQLSQGRSSHETTELKIEPWLSKARDTDNDQLCKDVDLLDFHIHDKRTSCNLTADKSHWNEITSNEIHGSDNIYLALSDAHQKLNS